MDIGSQIHYARAFDNRGRELTKKVYSFGNSIEGFNSFIQWAEAIKTENSKTAIMIGCEPTGHYWFSFGKYVTDRTIGMKNSDLGLDMLAGSERNSLNICSEYSK